MRKGIFIVNALRMKVIRRMIINQKEVFLFWYVRLKRLFLILTGSASAFVCSIMIKTRIVNQVKTVVVHKCNP